MIVFVSNTGQTSTYVPPPPVTVPPLSVAPPALPPVGVVILDNRGQVLGTEADLVANPDLIAQNYTPTTMDAANATLTTSQNIIDANNDPTHAQTTIAQIAADSGGAAHNVVALGVFDMNNSKKPSGGLFGGGGPLGLGQFGVLGESFAGALGGFIAGGPIGAAAGLVSAYGTAESGYLKDSSVNPTNSGAFASGGAISEASTLGEIGKIVGLGATADANSGSDVGGDLTTPGTVPDVSGTLASATGLSTGTISGFGNIISSGGSTSSIIGAGTSTLGDSGLSLPDLPSLGGIDLSQLSDWASLSQSQQQTVTDLLGHAPTSQDIEALQSIFNTNGKTGTTATSSTAKPAATPAGTTAAAAATPQKINPLVIAGIVLDLMKGR